MPAGDATWAHAAFALGYAEDGDFPVPHRTQAACLAIQRMAESSKSAVPASWIIEAGRTEGKRSSREKAHRALYDFHTDALSTATAKILSRLDTDTIAGKVTEVAKQQSDAGADPVARRKAVQHVAVASIAAHVSDEDRQNLDGLNAAGWAHASAYGTAEAQATPPGGGPPDAAKVAALAATALTQIPAGAPEAATATWSALELQTVAMGAALAAGDGQALGEATRAVKAALIDSGRATRAYTDQLHAAVTQAYVAHMQVQDPEAIFDWVTADDPCDNCEDAESEGPYSADELPDGPPLHANCLCDLEMTTVTAGVLVDA